jgi:hypothetical protein
MIAYRMRVRIARVEVLLQTALRPRFDGPQRQREAPGSAVPAGGAYDVRRDRKRDAW